MVNCINLIIEMSPRFILGRENVPCVAEVVNRSLKADCTNYTHIMFWNCKSLRPKRKEPELCLKENNFDIVALYETFLTKTIDFKI